MTIASGRLVAASALVAGSWLAIRHPRAQQVERQAADAIRGLRSGSLDPMIGVVTDLGSVYGLAGTAAALAATGRRRPALELLSAGGVAWVLAQSAKPLANRPRPYDVGEAERLVAVPAGSSWPSGHSAVATAMGLSLAAHGGAAAGVVGTALAAFVGSTRVYVGVHHPTDVIAGVGVGTLSHTMARAVLRRLGKR